MRSILLFLLLAGGGVLVLALATGGFRGVGREAVRPEVPVGRPDGAARPGGFKLSDVDPGGRSLPPSELTDLGAFSTSGKDPATWSDPLTAERIDFPEYVRWFFRAKDTDPVADGPAGGQGIVFKDVRVLATKEAAALTREEARALRAGTITWNDLVRLEVTAAEGRADFLTPRLVAGEKRPAGMRTIVRFTKDVALHDVTQDVRLKTDDVTVDLEAGTASGPGLITATSPDWTLVGRGFRLERDTSRLEILEDARLDVARLPSEAGVQGTPFESGGPFRPARVRSRGGAVVSRRTSAKGSPYEVRLEDRVHVEQEGGRSLDADVVTLTLTRRENGEAAAAAAPAGAPPGTPAARYRVSRLLAEGHVALETPRAEACGEDCLLRISTERFVVDLPASGASLTIFEGPSTMAYRGELALPGATDPSGRVTATCIERMTYGPVPGEGRSGETALSLEGDALVVVEPLSGEGAMQRLAADTIRLSLRRPPPPAGPGPTTAPPTSPPPVTDLIATRFVAEGRVRIEGSFLAGSAQRIVGEGLDRPDYLVTASGDGVRFVVHEGPARRPTAPTAAGSSDAAARPADGADEPGAWTLASLVATRNVRARFSGVAGERPLELEGESLIYAPGPGGMLRGDAKRGAGVLLRTAKGKGDSIRAAAIGFRLGDDGDRLWTEGPGRTTAVLRVGDAPSQTPAHPAAAAAPAQDLHLRGKTRIEIEGAAGSGRDATMRILGQGEIEVRPASAPSADPPTHRLSADTLEVGLARGTAGEGAGGSSLFGRSSPRAERAVSPARAFAIPGVASAAGATSEEWTLTCATLALSFSAGDGGLRELTAEGGVLAASATNRFHGTRLRWDGAANRGALEGGGDLKAVVQMGSGDLAQNVASSRVEFGFEGGRVRGATFRAPVVATLNDLDAASLAVTRYVLRSDADLVLDGDRASTDGAVDVSRSVREKPGAAFGAALVLTTRRIVVVKPDLLGGKTGRVTSMVAEGKGTRVEMGTEGTPEFLRAIGDRLEYDAAQSRMTMTGEPDVWVERSDLEGTLRRFVWDPDAQLPDIEGAHFRLRRR